MALEMKYFILKPKSKYPHDKFAAASRLAMVTFAEAIKSEDPELCKDLWAWTERERDRDKAMAQALEDMACPDTLSNGGSDG